MKKWMVVLLVLIGMSGMGQVPTWEWARTAIGGSEGLGVALDHSENIYFTGECSPNTIFGNDTIIEDSTSIVPAFLVKYDSAGNVIWARGSTGRGQGMGYVVATDNFGYIYLTGTYFSGSISFGSFTLDSIGLANMFLVKYDSLGNVIWAKRAGDTTSIYYSEGIGVATDPWGYIYVTGIFTSPTITFGTFTVTGTSSSNLFIVKYDPSGNVVWAKSVNGPVDEHMIYFGYGITTDHSGNFYLTGDFDTASIIIGSYTLNNSGIANVFIAKCDSAGNVLWAKQAGGTLSDFGSATVENSSGEVYLTGNFTSPSITFGSFNLLNASTSNNFTNLFLVKYDKDGNVIWAITSDDSVGCSAFSLAIDSMGNPYISGGSLGSDNISFDTVHLQAPSNSSDPMFIVKFDTSGTAIWGKILGSGGDDFNQIAIGSSNNIYLGGDYLMSPFILGTDTLFSNIFETPFVAKLNYSNFSESIPQISPQPSISLFPNPFSTSATLSIGNGQMAIGNGEVQIINLLGQEVKTIPIINQKEITINRDNLAAGMYFYKIIGRNRETIATGKMVIN